MRVTILAVGRLKSAPEQRLAEDYAARAATLGRRLGIAAINIAEVPESRAATAALRRSEEASFLRSRLPKRAFLILLDEHGEEFTSPSFAALLRSTVDQSHQHLLFLVGGPDGHAAELAASADRKLSLGRMTWPHRLVRLMLAEQIYRSVTILLNHPYHRA